MWIVTSVNLSLSLFWGSCPVKWKCVLVLVTKLTFSLRMIVLSNRSFSFHLVVLLLIIRADCARKAWECVHNPFNHPPCYTCSPSLPGWCSCSAKMAGNESVASFSVNVHRFLLARTWAQPVLCLLFAATSLRQAFCIIMLVYVGRKPRIGRYRTGMADQGNPESWWPTLFDLCSLSFFFCVTFGIHPNIIVRKQEGRRWP